MIPYQDIQFTLAGGDHAPRHADENYDHYHRRLSSTQSHITVRRQQQPVFTVTVPPTVFNPLGGIAAQAFISAILNGHVDVRSKRVVDMGCGCGIIGLAAIIAGCRSVLFTDINPNISGIDEHSLFRTTHDRVSIQNLCADEPNAAYDSIFFSIPSRVAESTPQSDSYESGIFRTAALPQQSLTQASRVLKAGGDFCFFYRIYDQAFLNWLEFHQQLADKFELATLKVLWHRREHDSHAVLFFINKRTG